MAARVTNEEFGAKVGCDFTTASKLRNGTRLPSRELLERIIRAYDLDANDAIQATRSDTFGDYLKTMIFKSDESDE